LPSLKKKGFLQKRECMNVLSAKVAVLDENTRRRAGTAAIRLAGFILLALFATTTAADTQQSKLSGGWHLVRTGNMKGRPEAVSVSHTVDGSRSDIDLAGIMLRCGEQSVEVIVVVVTPFPPHSQPEVSVRANSQEWRFTAKVISPGAELLLPAEASQLASGPWQAARELAIKVISQERSFAGVIPIAGIGEALAAVAASCMPG